jgi:hypothetical protein
MRLSEEGELRLRPLLKVVAPSCGTFAGLAIGSNMDGSIDPLSCSLLGKAVPPEQLADSIGQILENLPRNNQRRALADRLGQAAFAAQLSGLAASFAPAGQSAGAGWTGSKRPSVYSPSATACARHVVAVSPT